MCWFSLSLVLIANLSRSECNLSVIKASILYAYCNWVEIFLLPNKSASFHPQLTVCAKVYECVCVCVTCAKPVSCESSLIKRMSKLCLQTCQASCHTAGNTHTYTHTHTYIYGQEHTPSHPSHRAVRKRYNCALFCE